jgi:hypothetical protein
VFTCPGDTIISERAHGAFVHGSVWSERSEFGVREWLDECVKLRLIPGATYAEEPGYPSK